MLFSNMLFDYDNVLSRLWTLVDSNELHELLILCGIYRSPHIIHAIGWYWLPFAFKFLLARWRWLIIGRFDGIVRRVWFHHDWFGGWLGGYREISLFLIVKVESWKIPRHFEDRSLWIPTSRCAISGVQIRTLLRPWRVTTQRFASIA